MKRHRRFELCGCCDHYHRPEYGGDCRNNAERFTADDLDRKYGQHGWIEVDTDDTEPYTQPSLRDVVTAIRLGVQP